MCMYMYSIFFAKFFEIWTTAKFENQQVSAKGTQSQIFEQLLLKKK